MNKTMFPEITFDYTGKLSPGALQDCDYIAKTAWTERDVEIMTKNSFFDDEILEHVTFRYGGKII
jgi:hypothetical protein